MKRILLCTHGDFAIGIKDSVDLICGMGDSIETICVKPEDSIDTVKNSISKFIEKFDKEDNIIIFTDILGGSPTQAAFHFIKPESNTFVVSGLNLGLLLEVVLNDSEDTRKLLIESIESSKQMIQLLNNYLNQ